MARIFVMFFIFCNYLGRSVLVIFEFLEKVFFLHTQKMASNRHGHYFGRQSVLALLVRTQNFSNLSSNLTKLGQMNPDNSPYGKMGTPPKPGFSASQE